MLDLARSSLRYAPVLRDEQAALARRIEELAGRTRGRLPADLGPLGPRGLVGQQEGGSSHLASVGAEAGPAEAVPKPRRPHGQDRNACHLRPSRGKDDVWTWDFIFDRTSDGRSLKWLSLVDEYTRECLALEARRGMTAEDIRIILAEVAAGAAARRVGSVATTARSSWPKWCARGWRGRVPVRCTWRRGAPGRTVTRSHSIARFATNSWTARSPRANRRPER